MSNISALMTGLAARRQEIAARPHVLIGTFAATLFASAFLLFSVQPMFARMALPLLGGTPAVWAVSMCFFQTALLAGYCYAHALNRWMSPERAVLVHLALLSLTLLALPIGLPASLAEPPEGDAYLWLLGVLALGVGSPFFAVSASAPLLQAWFTRTGHPHAKDPYFLYGASNAGSLIALLAYPLVLEPTLGLEAQTALWSTGFFVLALMIAWAGRIMISGDASPPANNAVTARHEESAPLAVAERARWVALAALPSGLMTGVTTYITTDIGSAPFIWVVPLALYLLTFILVFKERMVLPYGVAKLILPALSLLLAIVPLRSTLAAPIALTCFFLSTIVCHRELYVRRPSAARLTDFYIWMSVGGVIGGVFAALIAPKIFATVLEFKLLLVLSLLALPGVVLARETPLDARRLALGAAALCALCLAYSALVMAKVANADGPALSTLAIAMLVALFITRAWAESKALFIFAALAWVTLVPTSATTLHSERSFFGTNRVALSRDGRYHTMLHGTTVHGSERVKNTDGTPVVAAPPGSYYHPDGPMARSIALARAQTSGHGGVFTAGIVGLGTGSLACYSRSGEQWRYYEIDPMVGRIALNPRLFSFLSRCQPDADIVYGDARLTLRKEPAHRFGYLLIDAFSSDAVPAHLLTHEAITGYFEKLAPNGLVAMHISNRFLDLGPVVAATAKTLEGVGGVEVFWEPTVAPPDAAPSRVVLLTRDPEMLEKILAWPGARPIDGTGVAPWTDDYSDMLSALRRGLLRSSSAHKTPRGMDKRDAAH